MNTVENEVIKLQCCCCGSITDGRQWWNRDDGYGLCADCAKWIATRETPEEMRMCYGEKGYHYDVETDEPRMVRYKNPWHKRFERDSREYFETDVKPTKYRGYLIYQRIKGHVWDVVKDGVCVGQRAGINGAKRKVDELLEQ